MGFFEEMEEMNGPLSILNVNKKNDKGDTPLILASYYGYMEVVEKLIKVGADINKRSVNGLTAWIIANSKSNMEIVEKLIKAGASTR